MNQDSENGEPYALDDPSRDVDPDHIHFHKIL